MGDYTVNIVIAGILLLVGLIHIIPFVGVLGPERLHNLYKIDLGDPNLILLMRHRAVLFALAGGVLVLAAWRSEWQGLALIAGIVSTASFIALAGAEAYNSAIRRVILIDWVALVGLIVGAALWAWRRYVT